MKNNLEKEFVPHTESLELKELGFDEPCFGWYQSSRLKKEYHPLKNSGNQSYMRKEDCNAPTFSQAFRWFREKHGLDSWIEEISHGIDNVNKRYVFQVPTPTSHLNKVIFFDTYEEAELGCLLKLIEIVKTKL